MRSQAVDGAGVERADADVSILRDGASPSPSAAADDDRADVHAAARATPATPANAKSTPAAVTRRAEEDDAPRAYLPLSCTSAEVSSARDGNDGTMMPRSTSPRALRGLDWLGGGCLTRHDRVDDG